MPIYKKSTSRKFSLKNRKNSFVYAFHGLRYTIATQHNMWIHLFAAVLVIISGFVLKVSLTEWLLLIFAIGLVLSAEIFNSAVELLTDMISPETNPKAGLVKDIAAGAVLVSAITAAVIGLCIFAPKIIAVL